MKDFTMCPVLLAMSLALTSCSDSHVKNKLSQLEQQAALEEANIKTITNFYEFMDQQDSTSLEKLIGKDFALFFGSSEEPLRYNQIKPLINKVYLAFPDYNHEIEIIFASGKYVTAKVDQIGTHSNIYMDIAPTGKKVSYKSIFIFTFEDGLLPARIVAGWKV